MLPAVVYLGPQARALSFLDSHAIDGLSVLSVESLADETLDRVRFVVVDPAATVDADRLRDSDVTVLTTDGSALPDDVVDRRVAATGDPPAALADGLTRLVDRPPLRAQLAALQETTRELIVAPSRQSVAEITVSAAKSVLDMSGTSLWTYDDTDGALHPTAMTDTARAAYDDTPAPIPPTDDWLWPLYEHGAFRVFDDIEYRIEPTDTVVTAAIVAPLGEQGLLVTATQSGRFDDTDTELFRILASAAGSALSRTERERQLKRQHDRLDQFTSIVSHDLQTPIQLAITQLELYHETGDETHLDKLGLAHDRMITLIGDLLTLARQGDTVDETTRVSLSTIAADAWHGIDGGDATLQTVADTTIEADPGRLDQLLSNLFANAVEHGTTTLAVQTGQDGDAHRSQTSRSSPPENAVEHDASDEPITDAPDDAVGHGEGAGHDGASDDALRLSVGVRADGDGFYVADDGPGIPATEREQIFERGYTTSDTGTGFGLAIVREIVDAHGWTISATESDAGGARFDVAGVGSLERE